MNLLLADIEEQYSVRLRVERVRVVGVDPQGRPATRSPAAADDAGGERGAGSPEQQQGAAAGQLCIGGSRPRQLLVSAVAHASNTCLWAALPCRCTAAISKGLLFALMWLGSRRGFRVRECEVLLGGCRTGQHALANGAGKAKRGKVERSKLAWKQEHRRRHLRQALLRGDSVVMVSAVLPDPVLPERAAGARGVFATTEKKPDGGSTKQQSEAVSPSTGA